MVQKVETFITRLHNSEINVKSEAHRTFLSRPDNKKEMRSLADILEIAIDTYEESKIDPNKILAGALICLRFINKTYVYNMIEENPNNIKSLSSQIQELQTKLQKTESENTELKQRVIEQSYELKRLANALHKRSKLKNQSEGKSNNNPLSH